MVWKTKDRENCLDRHVRDVKCIMQICQDQGEVGGQAGIVEACFRIKTPNSLYFILYTTESWGS